MSDIDNAWAAGLFDGEGCISIRKPPRVQLTIEIQMVHYPTLVRFAEICGGTVHPSYEHRRGRRTQWRWRLVDRRAEEVLLRLMPYLVTKREEADLAISMRLTITNGESVSEEIKRKRDHIRNAIRLVKDREWKSI